MTVLHDLFGQPIDGPFPEDSQSILIGMGCFWGAEKRFWGLPGVIMTSVGYAGGQKENPSYREVCTGETGHAEVVKVTWDPKLTSVVEILAVFWQEHNPTQWMRQGNDRGSQYRSCIFAEKSMLKLVEDSKSHYATAMEKAGKGKVVTLVEQTPIYWLAENYHQQYLIKNPAGYCGLKANDVDFDVNSFECSV